MIDFQYIEVKKISTSNTKEWLAKVIKNEGMLLGEIVYIFCNDEYLIRKNIEFLNHDTLTDVITFDYCKEKNINGDIFISTERVKENAKIYNTDYMTELYRVMVHGLLHLHGYKDKSKEEKELMKSKENYYISIK